MTVIDASVLVDALIAVGAPGEAAREELRQRSLVQVPAIFGAEVTSALRSLVLRGALDPIRATAAREQARAMRTIQYPFEPFSQRVWELRASVTVYDAWYIALAEWLETEFVTTDERLARANASRCAIRIVR